MSHTKDIFRPLCDPARAIYDAFQAEGTKRKTRTVNEWIEAERDEVYRVATEQAKIHGLNVPTREQVESAEIYACGHIDYGAKWAYRLVEFMRS